MDEMIIDSLKINTMGQRVLILKQKKGSLFLAIWIAAAEADAIAIRMQKVEIPRPLTHDLLCNAIEKSGGKIKSVQIEKVDNGTFYGSISIIQQNSQNNELILELNEAKELLEYALKATGVETFSPRIGDDIRDAFGIDEQYRTIPTKDENLVMTIAEVRKCGYFVRTAESKVCIIPSKVTVYVFNEEKKNEE